jgi:hypothetical protein
MAANTVPVFPNVPHMSWNTSALTAANTAKDGTGTVVTVFTADATDGSFVKQIRFVPLGTNVQTVARIFVNNGLTNATAANNSMIGQVTLPPSTNMMLCF